MCQVRSIAKLLGEHHDMNGNANFLSNESYNDMLAFVNDVVNKLYAPHGLEIHQEVARFVRFLSGMFSFRRLACRRRMK